MYVLNLQEPNLKTVLPDIAIGQDNADRIFREYSSQDILQPVTMQQYFDYYFYSRSNEMVYKVGTSDSLLNWLSDNALNPYAPKNNRRTKPLPLLMQSFKSAGRAFSVIDAPTHAVIVPYGKGQDLVAKLCGDWDAKEKYRALSDAQRYSVNVFPNVWEKLEKEQAIQETITGSGIYYLKDRHYSDEYGLTVDATGKMVFYDL